MSIRKNKSKCIMGMFRKRNRLVSSSDCLGIFNQHVMHQLETKQTSEIIVNKMYTGLFLVCQNITNI